MGGPRHEDVLHGHAQHGEGAASAAATDGDAVREAPARESQAEAGREERPRQEDEEAAGGEEKEEAAAAAAAAPGDAIPILGCRRHSSCPSPRGGGRPVQVGRAARAGSGCGPS